MSQDDRQIRRATEADAPGIAQMHVESWLETYTGIVPEEVLATLSVQRRTLAWESILRDPAGHADSVVYLKEMGCVVAGFGACGEQRDSDLKARGFDGEIGAIYVLRCFQKQGIGRALMKELAIDLSERGSRGIALWVLTKNSRARRFYEKCGGELIGERRDGRGPVILTEVAYGWRDIKALQERIQ